MWAVWRCATSRQTADDNTQGSHADGKKSRFHNTLHQSNGRFQPDTTLTATQFWLLGDVGRFSRNVSFVSLAFRRSSAWTISESQISTLSHAILSRTASFLSKPSPFSHRYWSNTLCAVYHAATAGVKAASSSAPHEVPAVAGASPADWSPPQPPASCDSCPALSSAFSPPHPPSPTSPAPPRSLGSKSDSVSNLTVSRVIPSGRYISRNFGTSWFVSRRVRARMLPRPSSRSVKNEVATPRWPIRPVRPIDWLAGLRHTFAKLVTNQSDECTLQCLHARPTGGRS